MRYIVNLTIKRLVVCEKKGDIYGRNTDSHPSKVNLFHCISGASRFRQNKLLQQILEYIYIYNPLRDNSIRKYYSLEIQNIFRAFLIVVLILNQAAIISFDECWMSESATAFHHNIDWHIQHLVVYIHT